MFGRSIGSLRMSLQYVRTLVVLVVTYAASYAVLRKPVTRKGKDMMEQDIECVSAHILVIVYHKLRPIRNLECLEKVNTIGLRGVGTRTA
jgi:hypothetical protein